MIRRSIQLSLFSSLIQAGFVLGGSFAAIASTQSGAHAQFNAGVSHMAKKDLREAEVALRAAVASNHVSVQPLALYNLGHVRFLQGKETLKGEGNRQQLLDSSAAATALAEEVLRRGSPIAERNDIQELIGAYMEARAARKQLRIVRDENTRELDLIGSALQRWRRAVGDFRSAVELNPSNTDAAFNADVVERHIDALLNFKKKLEQEQEEVGQQREKLTQMMKKMRGKIPKEMQRGSDEEEDDEEQEEEPDERDPKTETPKQQQQRIGGEREIDPDMLRVLKEKMPQRTMSVGQEGERADREMQGFRGDGQKPEPKGRAGPEGERGDREMRGFRGDGQKPGEPKGRKGRDW
jgi:tetratricopeptide (TPR) repeat protein